ncbi:biotin/lipoyl-binding protein, partial [Acinetobacter baumannii]
APFRVQLSPRTAGRIEFLQVREGDAVHKGEVLVRIDPSAAEATVAQQRSNLAEAESRYAQAQIQENPTAAGVSAQIEQSRAGLSSA